MTAATNRFRPIRLLAAGLFSIMFPGIAQAQLPAARLTSVFPAGGQVGSTVEVTIGGADLDDVDRLHFSHPGITAARKMAEPGPFEKGPQPVPDAFIVQVAGNVPPGLYEVRAIGKYGISNPRAFLVGDLPETVETEPNDDAQTATTIPLGSVVHGRSGKAADVDLFKVEAQAGQRVLVDCHARRIDSSMDATVVVLDPTGREVGSSRDATRRDPLVDFTAPLAGEYVIRVFDIGYAGGDAYVYRLAVGTFPHIDFIDPPAGAAGSNGPYTIYGRNLPGGQPAGMTLDGRPLEKKAVSIALPSGAAATNLAIDTSVASEGSILDGIGYRVKGPGGLSNPVLVCIATAPVVAEKEPNDAPEKAQPVEPPCEYVGRFFPRGDHDWVTFTAKKGETYTIEVYSQRMGLKTDPSLVVQQVTTDAEGTEQMKLLQAVDESDGGFAGAQFDLRTADPAYRFEAPADGTYRVMVRDAFGDVRGDPRNAYRLAILRDRPDFRLVAVPKLPSRGLFLRKGGHAAVRVIAFRRDGFDGDIEVSVSGLPAGVTCPGAVIGAGRTSATLVLSAAGNAAPALGALTITGKATVAGTAVTRVARSGASLRFLPAANNQPARAVDGRLARNLVLAVSAGETAPLAMQAGQGQVYEVPRAGIVKVPCTLARNGNKAKVDVTAADLPANVTANKAAFNPGATTAELQLTLKNNTPTGTYTIYLAGQSQVPYSRNPEAAKAAAERQKELAGIVTETTAKSKAAATAKAAADKAAAEADAALKKAQQDKATAEKALTDAEAAAKAAAEKAAAAKAAAAKTPDDKNLAAASLAAAKAAEEATAKQKTAAAALTAAEKALKDATAKAEAAAKAKAEADKAAEEAADLAKAATTAKAEADKRAKATADAAKQKNVPVVVSSTPVTLKITPAPVTLSVAPPKTPVKQGEKLEVPVSVQRLYGFTDPVTISAAVPNGVAGLQIPNATIAKGQTQTKLVVTANETATLGKHALRVVATLKLNNQTLTIDQPLVLPVAEGAPKKK